MDPRNSSSWELGHSRLLWVQYQKSEYYSCTSTFERRKKIQVYEALFRELGVPRYLPQILQQLVENEPVARYRQSLGRENIYLPTR